MSVSVKIPNLETQERIATAVEKMAGDYLKTVIKQQWLDMHPVGYIWTSFSSADPSEIVGGTWQQLKDVSLVAAGDIFQTSTISTNQDGGEVNHTLTQAELPNITGSFWNLSRQDKDNNISTNGVFSNRRSNEYSSYAVNGIKDGYDGVTLNFGENKPHNNMGPYKVVYMWVRIA